MPWSVTMGSGKFGSPWLRMHATNLTVSPGTIAGTPGSADQMSILDASSSAAPLTMLC